MDFKLADNSVLEINHVDSKVINTEKKHSLIKRTGSSVSYYTKTKTTFKTDDGSVYTYDKDFPVMENNRVRDITVRYYGKEYKNKVLFETKIDLEFNFRWDYPLNLKSERLELESTRYKKDKDNSSSNVFRNIGLAFLIWVAICLFRNFPKTYTYDDILKVAKNIQFVLSMSGFVLFLLLFIKSILTIKVKHRKEVKKINKIFESSKHILTEAHNYLLDIANVKTKKVYECDVTLKDDYHYELYSYDGKVVGIDLIPKELKEKDNTLKDTVYFENNGYSKTDTRNELKPGMTVRFIYLKKMDTFYLLVEKILEKNYYLDHTRLEPSKFILDEKKKEYEKMHEDEKLSDSPGCCIIVTLVILLGIFFFMLKKALSNGKSIVEFFSNHPIISFWVGLFLLLEIMIRIVVHKKKHEVQRNMDKFKRKNNYLLDDFSTQFKIIENR